MPPSARWLAAFLDKLGISWAHLIGDSMGGRVALEMGLRHPERVDRMALLMPSPAFIRRREFIRVVRLLHPELAPVPVPFSHRQVVRGIKVDVRPPIAASGSLVRRCGGRVHRLEAGEGQAERADEAGEGRRVRRAGSAR